MKIKVYTKCIISMILLELISLGSVQSIEFSTLNSEGDQIEIIKEDKVQGAWDYKPNDGHTCRPAPTIIEKDEKQSRQFTVLNNESQSIQATFSIKAYDSTIMNVKANELKSLTAINSGEQKVINVNYDCQTDIEVEGWARIEFQLEVKKDNDSTSVYNFSMLKICKMPSQKYDLSIFVLMAVSVILVAFGAYQIEKPIIVEDVEQTQEVSKSHAFFFIIGGSFFLVIMFFFYEYIQVILKVLVLISAHSSMSLLGNEILEKMFESKQWENNEFTIPICGMVNVTYIISSIVALGIVLAYAFTKNWMLSNFIAFCIVMLMFKIVRIPSYMIALLLLGLAFFYDIFWVFYSDRIFKTSVMANVATKVDLPMMFFCPKINPSPIQSCSLIGLGDIVLPGIFVSFCLKFSKKMHDNNHYYLTCLGGYILGILICVICLTVFSTAQPALLYLSPCTLIPVAIHAIMKGEFKQIWNGLDEESSDQQNLNQPSPEGQFQAIELAQEDDHQKNKSF